MLFVTNRFPNQSIRTRRGRRFTFDLRNNAPSNSVFSAKRGTARTIKKSAVRISWLV